MSGKRRPLRNRESPAWVGCGTMPKSIRGSEVGGVAGMQSCHWVLTFENNWGALPAVVSVAPAGFTTSIPKWPGLEGKIRAGEALKDRNGCRAGQKAASGTSESQRAKPVIPVGWRTWAEHGGVRRWGPGGLGPEASKLCAEGCQCSRPRTARWGHSSQATGCKGRNVAGSRRTGRAGLCFWLIHSLL